MYIAPNATIAMIEPAIRLACPRHHEAITLGTTEPFPSMQLARSMILFANLPRVKFQPASATALRFHALRLGLRHCSLHSRRGA
jgi:hypothetical protein